MVRLLPMLAQTRRGAASPPSAAALSCHQVEVPPSTGLPPCPSTVPVPITPLSFLPVTLNTAEQAPLLVAVPHSPEPALASKLRGLREAYTVTPASIQTVTPVLSWSAPTRNA